MGSTGHGAYGAMRQGKSDQNTFRVRGGVIYKGKIPDNSGLEPVGANKLTLKVKAQDGNNILFQFKLNKDSSLMTIIGYKNGVPEVKCKVAVDAGQPSLDKVIASGTPAMKTQAVKMKDLFSKSTEVKENQLGSIANQLLRDKAKRKGGEA